MCVVICGADDFVAIAKFGRSNREWLAKYLDLSAGIPSHDRFNAILARIRPAEFEKCLLSWITSLHEVSEGQIIAIDGKTLRRSYDRASGDFCLAAKGNQRTLLAGLVDFFDDHLEDDFARYPVRRFETHEHLHGRDDLRTYLICPVPDDLPDADRWKNLKAIGIAINNTMRDGQMCVSIRYYILSRYVSARRFAEAVRDHWGIENQLHWQLDVTFGEDQSRLRKGHADANFSILRRTALSLLKNELTAKVGVKNRRLLAAWDGTYRAKVLFGE